MIAIADLAKIHKDVMDQFVEQWHLPETHWKRVDQDSIDALVQGVLGTAPTRILELSDTETTNPFVIAFPDTGCC